MKYWQYFQITDYFREGVTVALGCSLDKEMQKAGFEPRSKKKKENSYWVEDVMVVLGKNGWELVSVVNNTFQGTSGAKIFYFKREISKADSN